MQGWKLRSLVGGLALLALAFGGEPKAHALCAGLREDGTWQSSGDADPYRIRVDQSNCEAPGGGGVTVTVWVLQASGALYQRGVFSGQVTPQSDGSAWIYVQYGDGSYVAHQWVRWYSFGGQAYLRVYIDWESLDSNPSSTTDEWFSPTLASYGTTAEIVNQQAGRCLDADLGHIDDNGDTVQLYSCWNALNQNWYLRSDGSIVNPKNGKCLDADLGSINQDGTHVQMWQCNSGANQKWQRWSDGTIRNVMSGRCLDADLANIGGNGDRIQLWSCWGGANQMWWN